MKKKQLKELDVIEDEKNEELEDIVKEENKTFKIIKEIIPYIIILVVVVTIRVFFITPIIVSGESMKPTLNDGEIMLLNKRGKFERFSIVVIDIEKEDIIKRVIALPGEAISCESGVIFLNDRPLEGDNYGSGITPDFKRIQLADDEYFVLGDNRSNSLDSQELGPFKVEKIKGVTNFTLFPFNKFGKVK